MKARVQPIDWGGIFARVALLGLVAWLLNLSPLPLALHTALGEYTRAVQDNDPAVAAAALEQVAVYQPWRTDLYPAAARYYLQAGDLSKAEALFRYPEVVAQLRGEDYVRLGDAYQAAEDLDQAEATWRQGLTAEGAQLELYDRLHTLYQQQGDYPAAVEALRATLVLKPDEPARAYRLGLYLAALQPEAALVYLEQAASDNALAAHAQELQRAIRTAALRDESAYVFVKSGQQLADLGEWPLAREGFRQATLARPDYAEAWALLGEALQQDDSSPKVALAALEQGRKLKPDSALVNSLLGLYWERQGDVDKMVTALAMAAEAEPDNPIGQAELGRALALQGDLDAARQCYEAAVQLAPQETLYWRLLGEFSLQYKVEIDVWGLTAARQALALQPDDPAVIDLIGAMHLALRSETLAERFFLQAVQVDGDYALAWLHLGALYLSRGEVEQGRALLLRADQLAEPGSGIAAQVGRLFDYYFP